MATTNKTNQKNPSLAKSAQAANAKPAQAANAPAQSKPAEAPKADAAQSGDAAPVAETKLSKRVTFWSVVEPSYSVRVLRTLADKYEPPYHGGQPMVRRTGRPAGVGGKRAKEEREKLLASMTEEEKIAFLAKEREIKKAKKAERKAREREALKEQLRKELEAELAGKK